MFSLKSMVMFSFIFLSFVAHADLAEVKKAGVIKIAVDTTYPPMEFEDLSGKVIGLEVDLANEMAKALGVKTEFVVMPWDGILAGLSSKRYDIIFSSMNITPERQQQVNFVEYLKMGQVFVVKKSDKPITSEKQLAGKVVAVQADTTSFSAVEEYKKNGIAIKDIKAFKGATECFSALKAGQAEAIVIDEAVGRYYAGLDSKTFVVSGIAMKPEPIGIAVRKEDKKLHEALTKIMGQLKQSGTTSKVYEKWLKSKPTF